MKALVIAGSGQVGGALLEGLRRGGIEAVGTHHRRAGAGTIGLDITDAASVSECVGGMRPDAIFLAVNTAGGVDYCEEHPEEAHALNVQGTANVVEAARRLQSLLVYFSTDYVFDGSSGPYSEEDEPRPINAYGVTKWEAENLVRARAPRHLIIRTTAVFGWERGSRNFAMQIWENLRVGRPLRVPDDQWCNPTLAEELAKTVVELVTAGADGVFNVVGKDRVTRAELGKALAKTMELEPALISPVPTSETGQRAARPLQGGLRTEKLARFLGRPAVPLHQCLELFRNKWKADRTATPRV
ncbi:MAG: SDR family oxidoreductase [Gemmatimonadetes bacterium]|nr:SDR family oxidoreductase [Gemmatimonadota bacterium]